MRTKTTLLCAAALAAGVVSSMAQSNVYSLNIVGYANVPAPIGYSYGSNPFEVSPSDSATNVIPNVFNVGVGAGPWDGSQIQIWTGTGFKIYDFDSFTGDTSTGFTDAGGNPVAGPTLSSSLGYVFYNGTGVSNNITYVGTVRTGTNSVVIPLSIGGKGYALGSPLPVAGGISTVLNLTNIYNPVLTYGPLDGCNVQILQVNPVNGQAKGYKVIDFDSFTGDTTTGFTDSGGNPVAEPQIAIGQGFYFVNGSPAGAYTWSQILNP